MSALMSLLIASIAIIFWFRHITPMFIDGFNIFIFIGITSISSMMIYLSILIMKDKKEIK